jgi:hypothetical protein
MYGHFVNVYCVGSKKGRKYRKEGKKERKKRGRNGRRKGRRDFRKCFPPPPSLEVKIGL